MDALQLYLTGLELDLWFQGFHQPENFIFDMKSGTCCCHILEISVDGMSKKGVSSPLKKSSTNRTQTQDQNWKANAEQHAEDNTPRWQLKGTALVSFLFTFFLN